MHRPPGLRLQTALCRLLPPPAADSDADLIDRYVADRDERAFEALVRRHGPMVLGVCRRELGGGPDAVDAFQVAFLVLARDAGRIKRSAALPGWLYRVARMAALKVRAKRRITVPVRDDDAADPADPPGEAANRELWAALDRELAALSDKLRAAFVMCELEERSSGEAARILGCPVGTVESRLAAARAKLRDRLARRGFGLPAVGLAAATAGGGADAAVVRMTPAVVTAAGRYTGGGAADPLSLFADGVTPTMGITKLKALAVAGMCAALFGTAGVGLWQVSADPPKADSPPAVAAKPDEPKRAEAEIVVPAEVRAEKRPADLPDERAVRAALTQNVTDLPPTIKLKDLLDYLHTNFGIIVRLDAAAFKRLEEMDGAMAAAPHRRGVFVAAAGEEFVNVNVNGEDLFAMYDKVIQLPITRGMSVADVLTEAVAQLPVKCSYRVRGNQVLIVPAYRPPTIPGGNSNPNERAGPFIAPGRMLEQIVGDPVSVSVEDKSLVEVLKDLRKLTGANIVLDARCKAAAAGVVSGTFDDTRLLTVLTVFADQCDLAPVPMNNVYYVTSPENAAVLQEKINRDLFGDPPPPADPGKFAPPAAAVEKK